MASNGIAKPGKSEISLVCLEAAIIMTATMAVANRNILKAASRAGPQEPLYCCCTDFGGFSVVTCGGAVVSSDAMAAGM